MDRKEKKELTESDICDLYITPAIKDVGWDPFQQIRREFPLTPGPIIVRGNMSSRNKKKRKRADYVLSWKPGVTCMMYVDLNRFHYAIGRSEKLRSVCATMDQRSWFKGMNQCNQLYQTSPPDTVH